MPGKNIKPLNGKLLIQYTYDAALDARFVDKAILTTNSAEIAASAKAANICVPFLRPPHLALDNTPTLDVIEHAINFFDNAGQHFDVVTLLQPTCPFRGAGFVDRCIAHFIASGADSLVSVKPVPHEYNPHWVFEPDQHNLLTISTGEATIIPSRQLLPKAFVRDGSVYVFKADNIRNQQSIYGQSIAYLQSDNLWHVNIDTADDWKRAELIARFIVAPQSVT